MTEVAWRELIGYKNDVCPILSNWKLSSSKMSLFCQVNVDLCRWWQRWLETDSRGKSSTQLNDARQFQSISLLIKPEYISIPEKSSSNFSVTLETPKALFIIHLMIWNYCDGDDFSKKYLHCVWSESLQYCTTFNWFNTGSLKVKQWWSTWLWC